MSQQTVSDLSDADVLENSLGLYLKPVSKIKINVQLPKLNLPGQSISTYHVMEKLKETVRPDTFIYLKSLKITTTVIKFEGELETRAACDRALARLRAAGTLKIVGSADSKKGADKLQVRAAHATAAGPTRHDWEAFFRDAKGVNEMRPGERPDTVHLQDLPIKWFNENHKSYCGPNDKLVKMAFGGFGKIRRLEIPSRTQGDSLGGIGKTGSPHKDNFEVYIQYEEYVEFAIAIDALRGKKLLYKDMNGKVYSADIKVDFDRTKYLSEVSIRKREIEERKLKPEVEKESKKITSSTTNQSKQSLEGPLKNITIPKEAKAIPTETTNTEPKTEVTPVELSPEERRKRHLEAKLLLGELLRRAEKTERLKEPSQKEEDPEPQKCPKRSSLSDRHHKKTKTISKKDQKIAKTSKRKHSEERASPEIHKQSKVEKVTYSEGSNSENPSTSKKAIKAEVYDKKHNSKLKKSFKYKEELSKPIEGRSKEDTNTVTPTCDKTKKEKVHKHTDVKKVEREETKRKEQIHEDFQSASTHDTYKDKSRYSDHDKTPNDYKVDKNNKQKDHIAKCDKTDKLNNISKHDDSKNCSTPVSNKEDKNVEVSHENALEGEELRMLMEERRLKDRLMQSYYQKQKNEEKLLEQERILKQKLVRKIKAREKEKLKEREKLRKELSGRNILKSVLADTRTRYKKY
ncbi:hypothetical protein JTE90_017544 [Oedothorax gibbosus]|uniref:A-kinase anchor protein 17A n=1 Tax=Oedothorax gibbosus TaxID=931172 RepID=A0AAV6TXD5_9ARAC|nr:hypothetical protein JTE90_017544 [Oedothorax gibbosus]